MISSVRANRAFLTRAVRYLAMQQGIHQFLDIGTGIPAANNTHEVAQSVTPQARVVYVDNDPMVLANARALLSSGEPGVGRVGKPGVGRVGKPDEKRGLGAAPHISQLRTWLGAAGFTACV